VDDRTARVSPPALSGRVGDLLRTYRLPFEERARGPLVVLATLPGEMHALK